MIEGTTAFLEVDGGDASKEGLAIIFSLCGKSYPFELRFVFNHVCENFTNQTGTGEYLQLYLNYVVAFQ